MRKVRLWWKKLTCEHNRVAKFYPKNTTWENKVTKTCGPHNTVVVEGCLNCGKMIMRDYGE